jgi:hypothetical protein
MQKIQEANTLLLTMSNLLRLLSQDARPCNRNTASLVRMLIIIIPEATTAILMALGCLTLLCRAWVLDTLALLLHHTIPLLRPELLSSFGTIMGLGIRQKIHGTWNAFPISGQSL